MPVPLTVRPFSRDSFASSLVNEFFSKDEVTEHSLFQYLHDYLADIGTQTICIEHEYVDRDYLDDFASFYVKSYPRYARTTNRIHTDLRSHRLWRWSCPEGYAVRAEVV